MAFTPRSSWRNPDHLSGDAQTCQRAAKKVGGMEFYDVNFSYIDNETFEEHYVSVPEQGGGKLIPEGMCNPDRSIPFRRVSRA